MSGKVGLPPGSARLAFAVPWLESVTALADGTLTIRFAEGRTVDSIVLLNDKHQELTRYAVRAMPGEALVLATRVLADVTELALPIPTEDEYGVCSVISRQRNGNQWVYMRRVSGRILDREVARDFGGGTFRIDTVRVSSSGTQERIARRMLAIDASWRDRG